MSKIAPCVLRNYLLGASIPAQGCLKLHGSPGTPRFISSTGERGGILSNVNTLSSAVSTTPFRKQLKEEAKLRKSSGGQQRKQKQVQHPDWELTVGIEIHAQLNTPRKLFSSSASSINALPNEHVSLFDLAIPGSQPIFQPEVLIPAVRAALALNCEIQETSKFDRKHYFHWDQPSGYQITQYYQPFAKHGWLDLTREDGISEEDGDSVRVGIKQVQMEQDTAKTIAQHDGAHLLDFNRVGLPLIEIITTPCISTPSTAAAYVKKVQLLLQSVDACTMGMEAGGLRADVNVSVRRKGETSKAGEEYAGFRGLGQRTEIKNLSSFKTIKDAIIAERDRQIEVIEAGGVVAGETRGWTIGSTETRRLRGKEGEVDYRYMPDPDIPPLVIGSDLVDQLRCSTGVLPDNEIKLLTTEYGLTAKDALSLVTLDDGGRVEYFYNTVDEVERTLGSKNRAEVGRVCGNWVLHELGGLVSDDSKLLNLDLEGNCVVPAVQMATIISFLDQNRITGKTAKSLLSTLLSDSLAGHRTDVLEMIERENLWFRPMSEAEYETLAQAVLAENEKAVVDILKGKKGKVMFLVGQMMRTGEEGRVEPKVAEQVIIDLVEKSRT